MSTIRYTSAVAIQPYTQSLAPQQFSLTPWLSASGYTYTTTANSIIYTGVTGGWSYAWTTAQGNLNTIISASPSMTTDSDIFFGYTEPGHMVAFNNGYAGATIYTDNANSLECYIGPSSTRIYNNGTANVLSTDILAISYDGAYYKYYRNGVVLISASAVSSPATQPYFGMYKRGTPKGINNIWYGNLTGSSVINPGVTTPARITVRTTIGSTGGPPTTSSVWPWSAFTPNVGRTNMSYVSTQSIWPPSQYGLNMAWNGNSGSTNIYVSGTVNTLTDGQCQFGLTPQGDIGIYNSYIAGWQQFPGGTTVTAIWKSSTSVSPGTTIYTKTGATPTTKFGVFINNGAFSWSIDGVVVGTHTHNGTVLIPHFSVRAGWPNQATISNIVTGQVTGSLVNLPQSTIKFG